MFLIQLDRIHHQGEWSLGLTHTTEDAQRYVDNFQFTDYAKLNGYEVTEENLLLYPAVINDLAEKFNDVEPSSFTITELPLLCNLC